MEMVMISNKYYRNLVKFQTRRESIEENICYAHFVYGFSRL